MNKGTGDLFNLADYDLELAETILLQARAQQYHNGCFHCQQAIEKYLKALLSWYEVDFPKTYSLTNLLNLTILKHSEWEIVRSELNSIEGYAVGVRYTIDEPVTRSILVHAIKIAQDMKERVHSAIGTNS